MMEIWRHCQAVAVFMALDICYQNECALVGNASESDDTEDFQSTVDQPKESGRSPRRAFHMKQPILEPYRKNPKITMSDYDNKEIPRPLKLEAMVDSTPQSEGVDVTLVDAMVVLQTMVNLPDHVWRSSTPAVAEAV